MQITTWTYELDPPVYPEWR
nr:unnamed protein product [Callosobruchus chinensis]